MNSHGGHRMANRQKRPRRNATDYTVACICPLAVEVAPLRAMLDSIHEDIPSRNQCCAYILGELEQHNVVIAILPSTGNNDSATAVTQLLNDYTSVKFALLVGIGAGVPGRMGKNDIRLGDVIVSEPTGCNGGVIQFDRGKHHTDGRFELTGHVNKPSPFLNAAVKKLKAQHYQEGNNLKELVLDMVRRNPNMSQEYTHPTETTDQLFQAKYYHVRGQNCDECSPAMTIERPARTRDQVQIHYGTIGSSNSVMRDAIKRDKLRDDHGVICIEMEAAAVMDHLPCLVVRGVCDYGDSHKNKDWQPYAAAVAAAYAREFLRTVRPSDSNLATANAYNAEVKPSPRQENDTSTSSLPGVLLDSLAFTRMDARLHNISDPLPRTCKWLLSHPTFRLWTECPQVNEHNGFLWIKGKPGSGKSTIMKSLLTWEKKNFPSNITASYFFNARAPGDLEKSSIGLYRSLCHQLLLAAPIIQPDFMHYFKSKESADAIEDWTVIELQSFLNQAIQEHLGSPLTILIDALDEGTVDDIRDLVAFLEDLSSRASATGVYLRICLSSRFYPHISVKAGLELVLNDQVGHQDDIRKYIKKKLFGCQSSESLELQDRVYQKSASIFLWVVLVIPILNRVHDEGGTMDTMADCLEGIPAELDGLFANILGRNSEKIRDCVNLLQWVLFSRRALNPMELYIAINLNSLSDDFDHTSVATERLHLYLNSISRGLTELSKSKPPVVQFIHETVREFLKQGHGLQKIDAILAHNLEGNCHDRLKIDCLTYIEKYALRVLRLYESLTTKVDRRIFWERSHNENAPLLSFMKYCFENIFLHAEAAQAGGLLQQTFLRSFTIACAENLRRWISIRNVFQQYEVRKYTSNAPMLYILAEQGLINLLKVLMKDCVPRVATTERYGTDLQAACVAGHEEVALALIEGGSDINAEGGEWKNAFFAAIRYKHESIAKLLIQNGARPSKQALQEFLRTTITRGYLPGVRLLYQLCDMDTSPCSSSQKGSLLTHAINKKQWPIVDWFSDEITRTAAEIQSREDLRFAISKSSGGKIVEGLKNDDLIDASTKSYDEGELSVAVGSNCARAVKTLLHSGAEARPFELALYKASSNGRDQTVRWLLEAGVDVNARGGDYSNALQAAAEGGHKEIIEVLLKAGANVNTQGGFWGNALQAAAEGGHKEIIEVLLKAGANVNAQGGHYGNALQAASRYGHKEIIEVLLKVGANVNANAQGGYYGNALQAAATHGHKEIIEVLLKAGANVNAQGGYCGNALQAAAEGGHKEMTEVLLEAGANVNAQGGYYGNALQAAAEGGYKEIIEILLKAGADVKA